MTSDSIDRDRRNRLRWLVGVLIGLSVLLAVVWRPGCRQYPPVSSPESLYLMRLLYTACNTRDPNRLADVDAGVERLHGAGRMTAAEHAAFRRIMALARSGQWREAEQAALKFAEDQVGVAPPAPRENRSSQEIVPDRSGSTRPDRRR